jgi:hypothetical protein
MPTLKLNGALEAIKTALGALGLTPDPELYENTKFDLLVLASAPFQLLLADPN